MSFDYIISLIKVSEALSSTRRKAVIPPRPANRPLNPSPLAILALLKAHLAANFEVSSSLPPQNRSWVSRLLSRFIELRFTTNQLLSFAVLVAAAVIQFLWLPPGQTYPPTESQIRNINFVPSKAVCAKSNIFSEPRAISRASGMSLLDEVRRVAAEFEYPPEEVNKGVKEFIRQMGSFCEFYETRSAEMLSCSRQQTKVYSRTEPP